MTGLVLTRLIREPNQTLGVLNIYEGTKHLFHCKTLELPYRDNKRNISSVPTGTYRLAYEWSPRFRRNLWELKGVPDRSEVKIHVANFVRQLNGCIAVGDYHLDMDGDGNRDVRNSRKTLRRMHDVLLEGDVLEIIIH